MGGKKSQEIFEKFSNIKHIMKIRPFEAEILHVNRHDEANGSFSRFR